MFQENPIPSIQAIIAGNFINTALFLALLNSGDKEGQTMVIVSWCAAYLAALFYKHEWTAFVFGVACLALTAFAALRWLFGVGV